MAWYQLAANKNDTKAKNNIGHMLHEGHGIPVDYRSAVKWFVQAAKDENESAISNVGECFELGHGLPVDKMKALEWYSKINTHSPDVTRISIEGYTLTNEQKGTFIIAYITMMLK
jgi:TPR repeat protein